MIREVVVYNSDPVEVLISQSEVPENRPAGTVVGSLSVVDPMILKGSRPISSN